MTATVRVRTPEGVTFSLPLAGPVTRLLALVVDGAVVIAATIAFSRVGAPLATFLGNWVVAVEILLYFLISVGYGVLCEWFWNGRTLGKRITGLRVSDAGGLRLTFPQVFIRNLLRTVDSLPAFYLVGGIACVLSPRMQRLGDLAAGTIVVRTRQMKLPSLPPGNAARQNSLRPYRALAARLRQKVEPAQARIALEALRRRDALEPAARLKLFAELAADFRTLVAFPEDATLWLTDEQYVRNVVEILFERSRRE